MVNVTITKKFRGRKEEKGSSVSISSKREVKNSVQITNILKSATTEVTSKTFAICFDFKDQIDFVYPCQDDMIILEQVAEGDHFVTLTREDNSEYVIGDFLSQFERITLTPSAIGMVIIIGEFKL